MCDPTPRGGYDQSHAKDQALLTFLCGLSPDQWRTVNHHPPAGTTPKKPNGYSRAGLYEGRANLWLIQYSGRVYRYWNYGNVFQFPVDETAYGDLTERALQALDSAAQLRGNAADLIEEAERLELWAAESYASAHLPEPIEVVLTEG